MSQSLNLYTPPLLTLTLRSLDRLARAEKDLDQFTAETKREAQRSSTRHEEEVKALRSNSAALAEAGEKKAEAMKKEISDLSVSASNVISQ